jgi:glycosyltransferase involved in cell wall biosynthesis
VNLEELPNVSIIIPVFNQGQELLQCLSALGRQTYPENRFEAIVVDNGSNEPIGHLTERFSFVRGIREPKPGSYAARNRGIEASRGALLGFTDADCVPAGNWIERGVRAVQRLPGAGIVAGKIALTLNDPDNPTAAELFETVFGLQQEAFLNWGFSATANLFTTKETVNQVGLFDERLMSGGDMEWGQRLLARGLAQEYGDDVCVSHPARRTLGQLFKQTIRVAGGLQQVADQRGQGTTGLSAHAMQQLVRLHSIRANFSDARLGSLNRRLKFATVVWLVELVRTIERFRVHFGGRPSRV